MLLFKSCKLIYLACSIRTWSNEEGDKVVEEEANSTKADTTKNNPINTTSTKTSQTREEECLEEGGEIMPDQADKTTVSAQCGYCDKFSHYEGECRKKKSELAFTS